MDGTVGKHLEQNGKLPRDTRRPAATLGFVLRQPKLILAIRLQARARPQPIGTPSIHLRQVRQHQCRELIRPRDETFQVRQQGIVADITELILSVHASQDKPLFFVPSRAALQGFRLQNTVKAQEAGVERPCGFLDANEKPLRADRRYRRRVPAKWRQWRSEVHTSFNAGRIRRCRASAPVLAQAAASRAGAEELAGDPRQALFGRTRGSALLVHHPGG
jgi:hypothetical protein